MIFILLHISLFMRFMRFVECIDLLSVNPNTKFTEVVLIISSNKNDLKDLLSRNANDPDDNLCKAIELDWKNHMIELLELIRPDVMVSNRVDISWFLEKDSICFG